VVAVLKFGEANLSTGLHLDRFHKYGVRAEQTRGAVFLDDNDAPSVFSTGCARCENGPEQIQRDRGGRLANPTLLDRTRNVEKDGPPGFVVGRGVQVSFAWLGPTYWFTTCFSAAETLARSVEVGV
jgi:hypothetical protein